MVAPPVLIGIEMLVPDIAAALVLLGDSFGLELIERRSSEDPVGEIAVVDAGGVAITLLQAADQGPGFVLPRREPRVTQLVFGVAGGSAAPLRMSVAEAGLPTQPFGEGGFFVTPKGGAGLFGFEIATVVAAIGEERSD